MIKIFTTAILSLPLFLTEMSAQQYCIEGRFDTYVFEPSEIEVFQDIQYGEAINFDGDTEQLKLDIYKASDESDELDKKPLIILVHGGSLLGGDKGLPGSVYLANDFAQKGYVFSAINYRLGWDDPGECLGDTTSLELAIYRALQDTRAAIRYLKENGEEYNIDTNYIFLLGNSVGSTLSIYSAYAEQNDFPVYLYDSLGSIDSATNTVFNQSTDVQGIILKAGGVQYPGVLNNKHIPIQFFHGTCDKVVPYEEGNLFSCTSPVEYPYFYGGWYLSKTMLGKNIPYQLYTNEGYDHEAADDDTVIRYAMEFMKNILCNTLPIATEYYRFNDGGCLTEDEQTVTVQMYPNPFSDNLFIRVQSAVPQPITITAMNVTGQVMTQVTTGYYPPVIEYEIKFSDLNISNGIYFVLIEGETFSENVVVYRQK